MSNEREILEPVETVEEIDVTAKEWIQEQSDKEVVISSIPSLIRLFKI